MVHVYAFDAMVWRYLMRGVHLYSRRNLLGIQTRINCASTVHTYTGGNQNTIVHAKYKFVNGNTGADADNGVCATVQRATICFTAEYEQSDLRVTKHLLRNGATTAFGAFYATVKYQDKNAAHSTDRYV